MQGLGLKTYQVGLESSVAVAVKKINARGLAIKVNAADFNRPLGKMSAQANEFTKSLEASNARVIAFGASAAIIGGVTTSFAQLVIQATKVEKILTDINVVLGTTAANLQKFGDGLFDVARNTSQSLEVAAEAALEFSRQGLSMEETLKRTNDALILTRLTGLKAAESVKGLTAAVNGFADVGLSTTQIINKLAAVDVKFAVSADDLVNALARAGAVAQDAGVSFDQLIGAVTAAQQITARGGAVIGNSFKTIFTRIQRSSTLDRLEELGVAVRDIRGNTLPALTVLQNLSSSYDNLAVSTKAAVAEQVGGVFQINVLKAALKDLSKETSIYSQATMTSSQASNEAYQKNAILQKTLSSIANQTLTTVRELTANLGDLTIAPALKEFLESANNILGFISDMLGAKEGESLGSDFAQGIAKGIGNVIAGPGMVALVLIFGKLFTQALKFAKTSLQDLLQIKTVKQQELDIQEAIVAAMIDNKVLGSELLKNAGNKNKQEQILLETLKSQTKQIELQRSIARDMAPLLRASGVQGNLTVAGIKGSNKPTGKNVATGLIPNYSLKATPIEEIKEREGAKKGGYVAGPVSTMSIPKLGRVVYNEKEKVKKFNGFEQPAIMPPHNSKAGRQYEKDFSDKHGFDPYSYNGFIPNFALEATRLPGTNVLRLPKAKMITETTASNFRGESIKGWKTLEAPLDNIAKSAASYADEFQKLKDMGINVLQRKMYFSSQKSNISQKEMRAISRDQKKLAKSKGFASKNQHKITGNRFESSLFDRSLKGKGYYPSWEGAYTPKGRKSGAGDENFKVDFFAPGRKPIESKYGKYTAPNLIAKSIRLFSDKYIEDFLSKQGHSDLALNMQSKKLKDSSKMLTSLGYKDVGPKEVLRAGLSEGLIPNFANKITWDIDKKKGSYGLSSDYMGISGFANYLSEMSKAHPEMVSPKAAQTFLDRFKKMGSQYSKDKESAKRNNPIGLGNRGSKHYSAMAGVTSSKRTVSTNNLFIKDINKHIKHYNKHGIFAVDKIDSYDSLLSQGHIPNFISPSRNKSNKAQDKKSNKPRRLDLSWVMADSGGGARELRKIYQDIEQSAKIGKPYTQIDAGFVVGPRIPRILVEGQKLLNKTRSRGKKIPKMKLNGMLTPADLMKYINRNKDNPRIGPEDYKVGEEKEVAKYLRLMGLDPNSQSSIDLDEIKMFRGGFSKGLIPNFESQNWQNEKSSGTVNDKIKEMKNAQESMEDKKGSKNHSHYSNGLVPNFMIQPNALSKRKKKSESEPNKESAASRKWKQILDLTKSNWNKGEVLSAGSYSDWFTFLKEKKISSIGQLSKGPSIIKKRADDQKNKLAKARANKVFNIVKDLELAASKRAVFGNQVERALAANFGVAGTSHRYPIDFIEGHELTKGKVSSSALKLNSSVGDSVVSPDGHPKKHFFSKYLSHLILSNQIKRPEKGKFIMPQAWQSKYSDLIAVQGEPSKPDFMEDVQASGKELIKHQPSRLNGILDPKGSYKLTYKKDFWNYNPLTSSNKTKMRDRRNAGGFVPNFANPLEDAISREKEALRERGSAADIYIDQDDRLKNPKNPAGLLVANTRDEPKSGSQGVNRAISMGMDPKTHGASGGIVPNFMKTVMPSKFGDRLNSLPGMKNLNKQAGETAKEMAKVDDSSNDLMGKMIGLTTLTYAFEGALGGASESASDFQKSLSVVNSIAQGASQAAMLGMVANPKKMMAEGVGAFTAKGGGVGSKAMGAIKTLSGGLLGVGMAASAIIPIFEAVKENYTILDGPLDTLRKSAEKTSKGIDALGNAISAHQEIESTRNELLNLSNSSQAQTFDGEMKRLQLTGQLVKQESNLTNQASTLATALNLSEYEIKTMTSGTSEGLKKLQEATLEYQQTLSATNSIQALVGAMGEKGFFSGKREKGDELQQSIQQTNMARGTSIALGSDKEKIEAAYESLLTMLTTQSSKVDYYDGNEVNNTNRNEAVTNLKRGLADADSSELPTVLKAQVNEALKAKLTFKEMVEIFTKNKKIAMDFGIAQKESEKEYTLGQDLLRQIAKERAEILSNIRLEQEATQAQANLAQKIHSNMIAGEEFRNKTRSSLGILSNAVQVEAEMATKRKESEMQYTQDVQAANQKAIKARQDAVNNLLKEGSGDAASTFSQLNKDFTKTKKYEGTPTGLETEVVLETFSAQSSKADERNKAFEGNLADIQSKLVKAGHDKLAEDLKTVKSQKQANNKLLIYLQEAAKQEKLQETLTSLQDESVGVIHQETDISKYNLEEINKRLEQNKAFAAAEKAVRDQQLAIVQQEMHVSKNTLEGARIRLEEYKKIKNPAKKIRDSLHEELDATIETAGMSKEISDATFATLDSQEYRQKATEAMATTLTEELTQEYKSLVAQGARIEAEAELRKNTELYAKIIADKVKNERGTISNQITDRATTTQANLRRDESGRNTFDYRTEDEVSKLTDSTINLRAQYEANKAANFYALEATEQLSQSQITFAEEMDRLREKVKAKGFFQEGLNAVDRSGITATANVQTAQGKVAGYAEMGNTLRMAESSLELARAQKEKNIELNKSGSSGGGNSLFSDTIAVRIAETNIELERFNETLANTTFDSVKDGFRSMVDMMGDSTKDMGDMMTSFFGTIAKAISDKLLDRALNQLTSGIFDAFDLDGFNQGGLVGYNNGGSVGSSGTKMPNTSRTQTPAMLTTGEYVVRKKIVDRLGVSSLDKMNKSGSVDSSLTDLYSAPNEESFEMSTEGSAPIPPIMRFNEGGRIQSMMSNIAKPISKLLSQSSSPSNGYEGDGRNLSEIPYNSDNLDKPKRDQGSVSSIMKFNEGGRIQSMMSNIAKPISKLLSQSSSPSNGYEGDGRNLSEIPYNSDNLDKPKRDQDSVSSIMKFNEGGRIQSMMSNIAKPISKLLNQSSYFSNGHQENNQDSKQTSYSLQNFEKPKGIEDPLSFKNSSFLRDSQFSQNKTENNSIDKIKQFYRGGEVNNDYLDTGHSKPNQRDRFNDDTSLNELMASSINKFYKGGRVDSDNDNTVNRITKSDESSSNFSNNQNRISQGSIFNYSQRRDSDIASNASLDVKSLNRSFSKLNLNSQPELSANFKSKELFDQRTEKLSSFNREQPLLKLNRGGYTLGSPSMDAAWDKALDSKPGVFQRGWDAVKSSLSSSSSDSALTKIAKGAGTTAGVMYANYQDREDAPGPEAPIAPSTARLNTVSDLDLDPSSKLMSTRARVGGDSYSKQYGDYLLKKYQHDVDKQNEKVESRAQMWKGIVSSIGVALGTSAVMKGIQGVKGLYEARGGPEGIQERWKKEGINNLGDLREKKPDAFSNYQDSINKNRASEGLPRMTANDIVAAEPKLACSNGICDVSSGPTYNLAPDPRVEQLNNIKNLSNKASNESYAIPSDQRIQGLQALRGREFFDYSLPSDNRISAMERLKNKPDRLSSGGKVKGPSGIDKVGPVMLDRGEYVVKASSVNNIEKQYPGFFDQLNSMKMNQGGMVGDKPQASQPKTDSTSSNDVTVNINVSSDGSSSTSGGGPSDQEMAKRIKDAVVGVISQEKRVGGMLRG